MQRVFVVHFCQNHLNIFLVSGTVWLYFRLNFEFVNLSSFVIIIFLQIFKNLSVLDLCYCAMVCRAWKILSQNSSLWFKASVSVIKNFCLKQNNFTYLNEDYEFKHFDCSSDSVYSSTAYLLLWFFEIVSIC